MNRQDWERYGEDIRRTVQDAIDTRDFRKLNETITNTVNDAVSGITQTIKNGGWYNNRGSDVYRRGGSGQGYQGFGGTGAFGQNTGAGSFGRPGTAGGGSFTYGQQQYAYGMPPIYPGQNAVGLYRRTGSSTAGGVLLSVAGLAAGISLFTLAGMYLYRLLDTGTLGLFQGIVAGLFFALGAGGLGVCRWGTMIRKRVRRFHTYMRVIGQREYCNVRELSDGIRKSVKYVVKDLEYMISNGWFLQGHLDEEKKCLMVSHRMYDQYLKIQEDRRKNRQEEREQRENARKEASREGSPEGKGASEGIRLSPEVQRVIDEGDQYIQKIHRCNDAIPGREISAKISRMETVVDRIFDRVEQNPESVDDIRRLMEYYLPTTVKLLEAYQELSAQPIGGENIRASMKEIEDTLDTLNAAFEKLLDNLFQDTAWDVSSDISVLQTMLAQEGLTEDGMRK